MKKKDTIPRISVPPSESDNDATPPYDPEGRTIPQMVKEMSDAVAKLGPVRKTKDRAKTASVAHR